MDVIDGVPPTVPEPRPRKITCEFCECELGSSGEYKKLSDKAKKFRESEEIIEDLEGTIATLRGEIEDLKNAAREHSPATVRTSSGLRL